MVILMRRLSVFASVALCVSTASLLACTSAEGPATPPPKDTGRTESGKPEAPKPEPDAPEPEPLAKAAIASVQLIEDCPGQADGWRPPPSAADSGKQAAAPAAAERAADVPPPAPGAAMPLDSKSVVSGGAALGDSGPGVWHQPCTQSTMQIVFSGQGDRTAKVELETLRLLDPKTGKTVATLEAREPAAWADGAYQSWNETIGPRQEVKASYELTVPNWADVESKLGGGSSYGLMFVLEVDVSVGDALQTVRSAQFPREAPHVIVT